MSSDRGSRISLIAAMARNRVIGRENRLPWHLPADLRRFRQLTWGKPILMGRKTHESIGRALPGRLNLVLTRDPKFRAADGCTRVRSLEEAWGVAGYVPELMVIGGAALYSELFPAAARLYLTILHRDYDGDVLFPEFAHEDWRLIDSERISDDPALDCPYSFEVFDRISSSATPP